MGRGLDIRISDGGTVADVVAQFEATSKQIERARRSALGKLKTWVSRQVTKAVAQAVGTTQKQIKAMARVRAYRNKDASITIWIGTNPIKAQYLGKVRWTRRMPGARVGKRLFPGTWSWGPGSKTGSAVMRRTGHRYAHRDAEGARLSGLARAVAAKAAGTRFREGITEVSVEVREAVSERIESLIPEINERFLRLMRQEINYQVNVKGRARA